jgi:methyl-accepting chemotaxis protein
MSTPAEAKNILKKLKEIINKTPNAQTRLVGNVQKERNAQSVLNGLKIFIITTDNHQKFMNRLKKGVNNAFYQNLLRVRIPTNNSEKSKALRTAFNKKINKLSINATLKNKLKQIIRQ